MLNFLNIFLTLILFFYLLLKFFKTFLEVAVLRLELLVSLLVLFDFKVEMIKITLLHDLLLNFLAEITSELLD